MNRFPHLEKYKGQSTRHTCPKCNQARQFTRYILENGQYIAPHVGKCNRVEQCGYHYPPRLFYADNPDASAHRVEDWRKSNAWQTALELPAPKTPHVLPQWALDESLTGQPCNFVQYLATLFGSEAAQDLRRRFYIGTNNDLWPGSSVFWIMGPDRQPYAAQVINYDSQTGKTVKFTAQDGTKGRRASWIHSALQKRRTRQNNPIPTWLVEYAEKAPKYPVPFGLQLLPGSEGKLVGIVESAKTAVIMTHHEPDLLWLAVGSLSNLTAQRLEVVKDRELILYPDAGQKGFEEWNRKAGQLRLEGFKAACSDLLDRFADQSEFDEGYDLADYFINLEMEPAPIQKTESLPLGWSRNQKGELCDQTGLPVLDWWNKADFENAGELERTIVQSEKRKTRERK